MHRSKKSYFSELRLGEGIGNVYAETRVSIKRKL